MWCHNPEAIDAKPVIGFTADRCIHCGRCADVCPVNAIAERRASFDRERCACCGKCVEACAEDALTLIGEDMSTEDVFSLILRDKQYYINSSGGVTVSGGEPLLQGQFVKELFLRCSQAGIHTAIDTAGNVDYSIFESILPVCNLVLYDIKVMDDEIHKKYTGVSNKQILENLKKLLEAGINIEIRIPVICGVNDTIANMEKTAEFISGYDNIKKVKFLPYHNYGNSKLALIGKTEGVEFKTPDKELLKSLAVPFNCSVEY